jgi:hypothetical protein
MSSKVWAMAHHNLSGYFAGLHILGVISLVPWITHAPAKYQEYLEEQGLNKIWW